MIWRSFRNDFHDVLCLLFFPLFFLVGYILPYLPALNGGLLSVLLLYLRCIKLFNPFLIYSYMRGIGYIRHCLHLLLLVVFGFSNLDFHNDIYANKSEESIDRFFMLRVLFDVD